MRLLVVCILALSGWAAAAPGATSNTKDTPEDVQQKKEPENDTLAPALSDIARRKRGSATTNLPYSNYRPTGGMHRYRYPLYRKRSYRPQPSYDYEDDVILPEVETGDYLDYDVQQKGPSLFRERSLLQQQERKKKEMPLEEEGYFSDDFIPDRQLMTNPYIMPLTKKDSLYNLATTPYDLSKIGHMYEMGKRDEASNLYDYDSLNQIHSVGRKSPPKMVSPTEQFYDAIDSIRKKKAMFDDTLSADATERMEHLLKLKDALSSAAASRYLHSQLDPMIRRKRDVPVTSPKAAEKTNTTGTHKDLALTVPERYQQAQLYGDRRKRAFNDYYKWEKNALGSDYQPLEKRSSSSDRDYNDFLTREYFKSIARSVGQKKKRMAYAQFEADKRSSGLDEFLENPSMLQYMQSKLKEAEEEVAEEAEKELSDGETEDLLSNIVVRLDALEKMREALSRLEELQNEEEVKSKRTMTNKTAPPAKKRMISSSTSGFSAKSMAKAASKKRSGGSRKKKMSAVDSRRIRRMRRGEDILNTVFLDNTKDDCPVLDRILMNCEAVSEIVGDQDEAFREPCIRHEVCYMCGSGLSVSGHECDAVLSSSLEATCSGNLDCLSAAGDTFNLLSNDDRYDDEGTCTHDPCVRKILESR